MNQKNELDSIYIDSTTLKLYKRKRLFFSVYFRDLYYSIDPEVTRYQRECQLCFHMWLQRLTESEILLVMTWWYERHKIKNPDWWTLRHKILGNTKKKAAPIIKKQKREEYLRRKKRERQKKLELQQKGESKRRAA